jgi:hypothetical protein
MEMKFPVSPGVNLIYIPAKPMRRVPLVEIHAPYVFNIASPEARNYAQACDCTSGSPTNDKKKWLSSKLKSARKSNFFCNAEADWNRHIDTVTLDSSPVDARPSEPLAKCYGCDLPLVSRQRIHDLVDVKVDF